MTSDGLDHEAVSASNSRDVAIARYQTTAKEHYNSFKAARVSAFHASVDYGRWLLASGLLIHGASLYALNSVKDDKKPELMRELITSAQWNVVGIVCIMIAGIANWFNFSEAASKYDSWADPKMLYDRSAYPRDDAATDIISATRLASILFGLVSLFTFVVCACTAFNGLADAY